MSTNFLTEQEMNAERVARIIRSGFAGIGQLTNTIVDRRIFHDALPIRHNEVNGVPQPKGLMAEYGPTSWLLSTGYAGYDVDGQLVDRRQYPDAIEVPGIPEQGVAEPKAVNQVETTTVKDNFWRVRAEYLWNLLDDIDTASDMYRPDNSEYVQYIHGKVEQRFRILYSDGYRLRPTVERGSVGYEERMREIYPEAFNPIADRPDKVTGTPDIDLDNEIVSDFSIPMGKTVGAAFADNVKDVRECGACGTQRVAIRGRYPGNDSRFICPCCTMEELESIKEQDELNKQNAKGNA